MDVIIIFNPYNFGAVINIAIKSKLLVDIIQCKKFANITKSRSSYRSLSAVEFIGCRCTVSDKIYH